MVGGHLARQRVHVVFDVAYGAKLMVEDPGTTPMGIQLHGKSDLERKEVKAIPVGTALFSTERKIL